MTPQEKYLYHQIHPLKLLTDGGTGLLSLYLFWHHQLILAAAIALIPPIVASWLLIKFANLEGQRASGFGHYVQRYMSRVMETLRLVGYVVMAAGAWYHGPWIIGLGLCLILFAWLRGIRTGPTAKRNTCPSSPNPAPTEMPQLPTEVRTITRANPVGACIYCGSTDNLSDEHIVPFGLGGNLVLPKSSCQRCARITSEFERRVLRGFMRDARATGRFPTRRPKERPSTIPVEIKRGDHLERVDIPLADATGFMQLLTFAPAAFLAGRPPLRGISNIGFETIVFGQHPKKLADTLGTDTIQTTFSIDPNALARMIAKIGYSFAIANQGLFPMSECPVLPYILGSADDGGTWVGSAEYRLLIEDQHPNHALGLVSVPMTVNDAQENVLVAQVKLFASAGAKGYAVVVRRTRVSQHE